MRCTDLTETWTALRDWLDQAGVLILPRLDNNKSGTASQWDGLTVRLDAEVDHTRPATAREVDRVIRLLRAVIERFGAPAVYVGQTAWDRGDEPGEGGSLAIVTVRVPAGGVLHELTLVAAWYAALLSSDATSTRSTNRNSDWWPAA